MKKFFPDLIAVLIFVILSFTYFYPAITEGRILFQHDSSAGMGAGQEAKQYKEDTGKTTRWTNSLFGGMPTYQISPSYDSATPIKWLEKAYHLFLPDYVWYVFVMLIGFYILLRVMGVSSWLSTIGAVAWAFSSYFFILIAAGHIWKFITLAYIPPTIAGLILTYRGRYFWGGLLSALFVCLQILSNHAQMSYYFFFVMAFIVVAYWVEAYRTKKLNRVIKATLVFVLAGLLGLAINSSNLYHTYQYSKESMRGKSELKVDSKEKSTGSGLSRSYITQWSYGVGETLTLLVPNYKGGASVPLAKSEKAMEKANPSYMNLYSQLTQYFGDQPMTAGPVYVGAFILALFILGIFIVKGPIKWALVAATIFSIVLSWGRNFMPLTDFFIDYVPLYNKFRAVSSILVIAEFTIPFLAILALKEVLANPAKMLENKKPILISLGLTAGVSLLVALAPSLLTSGYISNQEMSALQNAIPANQLVPILQNLSEMRQALVTSDAWRSFIIIIIGFAILHFYAHGKLKSKYALGLIFIVCLVDLWGVNKRYLYDDQFVPEVTKTQTFGLTSTDKTILADKTLDFRVLNFASNTFNENNTSYWHKSIGGYHAAKLRRYQDMIEHYIAPEMQQVFAEVQRTKGDLTQVDPSKFSIINMLNARYFIFPMSKTETAPMLNPFAFGNVWLVNKINVAQSPNEEIEALKKIDLRHELVVDKEHASNFASINENKNDSTSSIKMTSYSPNKLEYTATLNEDKAAVFSEIYYPGWRAYLDGKEVPVSRVNYILRAINLPKGKHNIVLSFDPKSLHFTETVAYGAMSFLLVCMIIGLFYTIKEKRKQK